MKHTLAPNPFRPLTEDEISRLDDDLVTGSEEPTPITPVPDDAPPATFQHQDHGQPSGRWSYHDEHGRLLGYAVRFEVGDGKVVLPRTWCRGPDGQCGWRWKALAAPRPLYGLDRLARRPEAHVLVVEGEKTATTAQSSLNDHVAVTWSGGAKAHDKSDWSPLYGREIILWPDADVEGRRAAEEIATHLSSKGSTVRIVTLPDGLTEGWDLADAIPDGVDLASLLANARNVTVRQQLPFGYAITSRGLVWRDPADEEKEQWIVDPFEVVAETRDTEGSWGVLLEWKDHDGRLHKHAIPRSLLAGDGIDVRRILLDGGLSVAPGRPARERLTAFLTSIRIPERVTATDRIGWHGETFVLPDDCIGPSGREEFILQGSGSIEHAFRQRGTLQEWQEQIAGYAVGNSRILVAISAAFAACLLNPCEAESGGLHFRGPSSIGKSTALAVAGSVWGGGGSGSYIRSWRATSNGLEGVALAHSDTLLCLDELGQLAAREAGEVAYMLANGSGKSRSRRDGTARVAARWRVLFLSSGEIGLADKIAEDGRGRRLAAGQQVRVVDVPADAGAGLGLFESLNGFASAEEFARHLRTASQTCYGTPARAFIERIAGELTAIKLSVKEHERQFLALHIPPGADGQVFRVAQRFALIAAAGELAVACGVLPWSPGEATNAASALLRDWLTLRGGVEAAEARDGVEQVRGFLLSNGMARFMPAWETSDSLRMPLRDVVGFRKREDGERWDFYITSAGWRDEICRGLDSRMIAKLLAERGLLVVPASGNHLSKSVSIPGYGKLRLYHVPGRALEEVQDD